MLRTSMTKKLSRPTMPMPKLNEYSQLVGPLLAKLKHTPDADTVLQTLRYQKRARRMFVESHQEGLVVQESVEVGEVVVEMNGYVRMVTEVAPTGDGFFRYDGLGPKKQICIDTTDLGNDTKVTRRSCSPNAILEHVLGSGATLGLILVATKYIPRYGEVTLPFDSDYKESEVPLECAAHRKDISACPFEQERRSTRRLNQEPKDNEGIARQDVSTSSAASTVASIAPSTQTNHRLLLSRAERRKALQAAAIPPAETPKTTSTSAICEKKSLQAVTLHAKKTRPSSGNLEGDVENQQRIPIKKSDEKMDAESPLTENNFLVQLDSRLRSRSQTLKSENMPTSSASSSSLFKIHQPDAVPASSAIFEDTVTRRTSSCAQAPCRHNERKSPRAPAAKRPCPDEEVDTDQGKENKSKLSDINASVHQSSSRLSFSKSQNSKPENVPTPSAATASSSSEGHQPDAVPLSSAAFKSSEDQPTFKARHGSNISQRRSSASAPAPHPEDIPTSSSASTATPSTLDRRLSNRGASDAPRNSGRLIPPAKKPRLPRTSSTSDTRHRHRLGDLGILIKENAISNAEEEDFAPPTGCTDVSTCSGWAKDATELRREVEDQNMPGPAPLTAPSKRKSSANKEPLTDRQKQNREEPHGTSAGVRHGKITDVYEGNVLKYKRRRDN